MTTPAVEHQDGRHSDDVLSPSALRPPLKWAGGKRWQLPQLRHLLAPHQERRLVEPFCGGLAVVLGLRPQHALLNDANPHLIHFYRWVKRGLRNDMPLRNDETAFYENRDRFNALIDSDKADTLEAAVLFYYLNRTGYNGLCRFNQRGRFNVPFGRYTTINYRPHFDAYTAAFSDWTFTNTDFGQVPVEPTDVIYADPPYDVPFTHYSKGGFDWYAQIRVAEWLAGHPGPVILTNQATERVVTLYTRLGFTLSYLQAPRMISCSGERRPAREVLATRHI